MAFASNLAAANAARNFTKQAGFPANDWKTYFKIEKHDGEYHSLQILPFPSPAPILATLDHALMDQREGHFNFPTAESIEAAAALKAAADAQALSETIRMESDTAHMSPMQAHDEAEEVPMTAEEEAQFDAERLARANAFIAEQQAAADKQANAQASETVLPNGKVWIRMSTIEKPVKRVWAIADEMNLKARNLGQPAPTRKEVQDECVRLGIASGTARTQYQAWKKAQDNDAANAAKAAELSAAFNKRT